MESKEEVWKPVFEPYHELYVVSNFGRVKNVKTGHVLAPQSDEAGYKRVPLSKNNKTVKRALDVVVAKAFIPNPFNKPTVDHKDRDPRNNNVDNLEWATRKEQSKNRIPAKRIGYAVIKLDVNGNEIPGSFPNTTAAAKHFNVAPGLISRWIKEKRITSEGYRLEWINARERGPDLPGEEWKTVTIEGATFKVSSFGRVENKQGLRGIGSNHNSGYKVIVNVPIANGKKKTFLVQRVICEAFYGPPPSPNHEANHKDLNKHNNRADNLEWLTGGANVKHAYQQLGDEHGNIKRAKPVMQFDLNDKLLYIFKSARAATAEMRNIPFLKVTKAMQAAITAVCRGKRKSYHEFKWQYCDKSTYEKWKSDQARKPKRKKSEKSKDERVSKRSKHDDKVSDEQLKLSNTSI